MLIEFDINICDEKQKVENLYVCDIFIHSGNYLLHCELFLYLEVMSAHMSIFVICLNSKST